ncbi:MAG: hypothetical protein J6N76_03305 [Lachnospiraceae bacterium]|nr:hypothetical protein [Lachnospiraceae bacterium]
MSVSIIKDSERDKLKEFVPSDIIDKSTLILGDLSETGDVLGLLTVRESSGRVWELLYIYVVKAFRKNEIATDLIHFTFDLAATLGVSNVMVSLVNDSKKNPLVILFDKLGFEEIESSDLYQIPLSLALDSLRSNKIFSKLPPSSIITLRSITGKQWDSITSRISQLSQHGSSDDFFEIPYPKEHYHEDYSLVVLNKDRIPQGLILCSLMDEILNIDYLCSLVPNNPLVSAILIRELCRLAASETEDLEVHFHAYNPRISKLGKALLGDNLEKTGRYVTLLCSV